MFQFIHLMPTPPLTTRPLTKTEEAVFAKHDSGLPRTIQHSIFSHSKNLHLILDERITQQATRRTLYNFLNLFLSSQNAAPETPSKIGAHSWWCQDSPHFIPITIYMNLSLCIISFIIRL